MAYTITVDTLNKELDVSSIRDLLVRNSALADVVNIIVPRIYDGVDLSEKYFVIKTKNDKGLYFETVLPKVVEASTITLKWVVTREFTVFNGELRISILAADSEGFKFLTKETGLPIANSVTLEEQIAETELMESYLAEMRELNESSINSAEAAINAKTSLESNIVDGLTSEDPEKILSARQGKVLNERISNIVGQAGTSNTEIVDARNSTERGVIYPTLKGRLDAVDGDIVKSKYSTPAEATQSIISLPSTAVKGKLEGSIKGNTLYNAVVNGDFSNGTTGWFLADATGFSASNGVAKFTPISQFGGVRIGSSRAGVKYFLKAKCKVPTTRTNVRLLLRNGGNTVIPATGNWEEIFLIGTPIASSPSIAFAVEDFGTGTYAEVEVDYLLPIPMTGTPYENYTADQMNAMIDSYFEGMKSTDKIEVLSRGKNLFDINSTAINKGFPAGANYVSGNTVRSYANASFTFGYRYSLKLKPDTFYTIRLTSTLGGNASSVFHAINPLGSSVPIATITSVGASTRAFKTPTNGLITLTLSRGGGGNDTQGWVDVSNIQLEEGSTATAYEAYQETTLYSPVELGRVPNGVADEFTFDGRYIQRTKEYVLTEGDITALTTSPINVDAVKLTLPNDSSNNSLADQYIVPNHPKGVAPLDQSINVGKSMVDDSAQRTIWLIFTKGTYATLAQAKTALAGTKIIYQLATPIETQYPVSNLIAETSGNLVVSSKRVQAKSYNAGIVLGAKAKSIESVYRLTDDEKIQIPSTSITLAGDGMSITILNANAGEIYEVKYETSGGVLPTISYSYPANLNAQIQGNTEAIKQTDEAFNDFRAYQNVVNLSFDLRLIAGGH